MTDAVDRLCLMTVHAHPDDEASKGPGTVAKAHAKGIHTVLVCCTGGELGDILNPAMERPEVRENLAQVRRDELAASAEIIGYDDVVWLGYHDSGMDGSPSNKDPDCFAQADLKEAVGRLVAEIRRYKPQVIVTYPDDQSGYPHPDHLMVHEISVAAFDAAGDPDAYPELGEPWQPLKMYYSMWSRARMLSIHNRFIELDIESPFSPEWFERPDLDHRISTKVDITGFADVRSRALLAHKTQVDPESPFWFGLPDHEMHTLHPFDEYIVARSLVDSPLPEDDLFNGIAI